MTYEALLRQLAPGQREVLSWRMPGMGPKGKFLLGNGVAMQAGEILRALGDGPVLVLMGSSIRGSGGGDAILESLAKSGLDADVFIGVAPEPGMESLAAVADFMAGRGRTYGSVLGVGGGSVLDIAKLAAHTANPMALEKSLATGDFQQPGLPVALLPTTAGTGSECSHYAVMEREGKKVFYASPHLLAAAALVDPLLTLSMPPKLTASTALDALTHALEGAMSGPSPYSTALAVECAGQILSALPQALADGGNLEARHKLALSSVMGMMAYMMGGGLYAHSLSYILTLEKGHAHGVGCGLALPYTLALNSPAIPGLLDGLAARILGHGGQEADRRETIEAIGALATGCGLPQSLAQAGYGAEDVPRVARAMLETYFRPRNPRPLNQALAEQFLEAMYHGEIRYF